MNCPAAHALPFSKAALLYQPEAQAEQFAHACHSRTGIQRIPGSGHPQKLLPSRKNLPTIEEAPLNGAYWPYSLHIARGGSVGAELGTLAPHSAHAEPQAPYCPAQPWHVVEWTHRLARGAVDTIWLPDLRLNFSMCCRRSLRSCLRNLCQRYRIALSRRLRAIEGAPRIIAAI